MTKSHRSVCYVTERELLAYRDGELAPSRQTALTTHVADCPACRHRLAAAATIAETLQRASPLIDQPLARAALQARIAGDHAAWWRRPARAGSALPVVLLLCLALGLSRWLENEDCPNCPPQPVPMRVTSSAGLPAGWQLGAPCQSPSANRAIPRGGQEPLPRGRAAPAPRVGIEQPAPEQVELLVDRRAVPRWGEAPDGDCAPSGRTPQLGWSTGPRIGMAPPRSGPGA